MIVYIVEWLGWLGCCTVRYMKYCCMKLNNYCLELVLINSLVFRETMSWVIAPFDVF